MGDRLLAAELAISALTTTSGSDEGVPAALFAWEAVVALIINNHVDTTVRELHIALEDRDALHGTRHVHELFAALRCAIDGDPEPLVLLGEEAIATSAR